MKIHPVHLQHGVDMDPAEVSQSKNHVAVQKSIGAGFVLFGFFMGAALRHHTEKPNATIRSDAHAMWTLSPSLSK